MIARALFAMLTLVVFAGYKAAESPRAESFDGFPLVDKAGNIHRLIIAIIAMCLGHMQCWIQRETKCTSPTPLPVRLSITERMGSLPTAPSWSKRSSEPNAQMTTGDAHWASGTKVWFVMIKDEKGRYPDNPLWGDGWGWALFKSDAPDKQVATDYKKDCLGCHIPARTTDWVYVQGYPVLAAK